MKSTNRKVAKIAETNAEFFLNHPLYILRVFLSELCISALRSINIPCIILLAMPDHHFILGLSDRNREKVHRFALMQKMKMRVHDKSYALVNASTSA